MLFFFAWLFFVLGTSVVALPFPSPGELGQAKRRISPLFGCWTLKKPASIKAKMALFKFVACFDEDGKLIKTYSVEDFRKMFEGQMLPYERTPVADLPKLVPEWKARAAPISIDEGVDTIELQMTGDKWTTTLYNSEWTALISVPHLDLGPRTLGFWAPQQIHRQIPLVVHIHEGSTDVYFHNVDISKVFDKGVTFVRVLSNVVLHTVFKVPAHLTVASTSIEEDHRNDELQITMVPSDKLEFTFTPLNYWSLATRYKYCQVQYAT